MDLIRASLGAGGNTGYRSDCARKYETDMIGLSGKRIAVGGVMHETNTFQPRKTTYADFAEAGDRPPLVRGAEVLTRFDGINQSIVGALEVLRPTGATLLPLLWTSTTPAPARARRRCAPALARSPRAARHWAQAPRESGSGADAGAAPAQPGAA